LAEGGRGGVGVVSAVVACEHATAASAARAPATAKERNEDFIGSSSGEPERQGAQPLAGQGVHGVGDGGGDGSGGRFPDGRPSWRRSRRCAPTRWACRRGAARGSRGSCSALDPALLERELAVQHRREAVGDGSLDLRLDAQRIDGRAAVHAARSPCAPGCSCRYRPTPRRPGRRCCRTTRARRRRALAPSAASLPSPPSPRPASARAGAGRCLRSPARYSTGSRPADQASSSIMLSIAKAVCVFPTERHHSHRDRVPRRMQGDAAGGDRFEVPASPSSLLPPKSRRCRP